MLGKSDRLDMEASGGEPVEKAGILDVEMRLPYIADLW
jgi:hypothetical protein